MTSARTYLVPGISCENCKNAIEDALGDVPEVTGVEVDVAAKSVAVEGNATEQAVRGAIDEAGFEVTGVIG